MMMMMTMMMISDDSYGAISYFLKETIDLFEFVGRDVTAAVFIKYIERIPQLVFHRHIGLLGGH